MTKQSEEDAAVLKSKLLRTQAYAAYEKGRATPSQTAIVEAYPDIRVGFLSKLFNQSANVQKEIAFEVRDRAEYKTAGTTAALKIAGDRDLQEADRSFKGLRTGLPKRTM